MKKNIEWSHWTDHTTQHNTTQQNNLNLLYIYFFTQFITNTTFLFFKNTRQHNFFFKIKNNHQTKKWEMHKMYQII